MSRQRRAVPAVLITLALVSACGGGGGETPSATGTADTDEREAEAGGELTLALAEDPDALDPTLARTLVSREVFVSMCERLYDVDENLELIPQLAAELPESSEDGTAVTIPLREGVVFNDG